MARLKNATRVFHGLVEPATAPARPRMACVRTFNRYHRRVRALTLALGNLSFYIPFASASGAENSRGGGRELLERFLSGPLEFILHPSAFILPIMWHPMQSGNWNRCLALAGLILAAALAIGWPAGTGLLGAAGPSLATFSGLALLLAICGYGWCRGRVARLEQMLAAAELRGRDKDLQIERFKGILSGLSEPVIAVDNEGELLLANASAERLFEIASPSTQERALADLLRCEKLVELLADARTCNTSEQRSQDVEIADDAGQVHWFNATARPLTGWAAADSAADRSTQGAVAVLRDISEQKAIQRRNAEFVSAVSHEMKTPLAGIKAYVELLADGDADDVETQDEFLAVISSQTNRLQRLVDNLLKLARIEAGVVSVNKQHCSLTDLLTEALLAVSPAASKKRTVIVNEMTPMPLTVLADPDMIVQAAVHLLSNAIKYTPAGGRVVLRSRLVGGEAQFDVQDTGVGLCPDDCVRVFEKFYRVQKDKDMAAGTGLGLPLAKHIIEDLHRGRLTVESVLGQGSVFTVTLPIAGQDKLTPGPAGGF